MDDAECFIALRDGTHSERSRALTALVERYSARFLGKLQKWQLDEATREDCVATVFDRLWRSKKIDPKVNPQAYLWQMLRNVAVDQLRSKRPWVNMPSPHDSDESKTFDDWIDSLRKEDSGRVSQIENQECIDKAWEKFEARSPEKAYALQLSVVDELPTAEIAEVMQKKPGAAREFLSQAYKLFREILDELCPGLSLENAML